MTTSEIDESLGSRAEVLRDEAGKYSCDRHYLGGRLHRDDGPAVVSIEVEEWYHKGRLHRVEGPAVTNIHGDTMWYREGLLHRVGGPAIPRTNAAPARYFLNGVESCRLIYEIKIRIFYRKDLGRTRWLTNITY